LAFWPAFFATRTAGPKWGFCPDGSAEGSGGQDPLRLREIWKKARRTAKIRDYLRAGRVPWSRGYEEYREDQLELTLRPGNPHPDPLPEGFGTGLDERIVEIPWLFSRLPSGAARLLDAGSTLNREICLEHPLLRQRKVHVCTLEPEADCFWQKGVSYLFEDLRRLPYRDGWFDEVACLSVLEHIGMDNTRHYTKDARFQEAAPDGAIFAMKEFSRVLRPGGALYLTVPFGRAVSHGWLRIFDRAGLEELLGSFPATRREICVYRYSVRGWQACRMEEAADAVFFDVHAGKPWTPSQPACSGAVCCVALQKSA